jgi:hypothetical protein
VGDQPRPKKQGRQPLFLLAVSWQQASHAQCVTCDQRRRKMKKKKKGRQAVFQLETEREALVFETEARANSVKEEKK